MSDPLSDNNPITLQVLGICSALAVTNLMFNTLLMCLGLIWTATMTNITAKSEATRSDRRLNWFSWVMIVVVFYPEFF